MQHKIIDTFLGFTIGDALGVPVEFISRHVLKENPVKGMLAFGTHQQPAGTWSDDSSLALCLAEALCTGYDLNAIANNFVRWYENAFWTAHDKVFDVGIATAQAISSLNSGTSAFTSGNRAEDSNGNGSLMRIMPLIFYTKDKDIATRFRLVAEVSAITHAHIRSILSCFIYTEFALELLNGVEKNTAYQNTQHKVNAFLRDHEICDELEKHKFHRILENPYGDYEIRPLLDYSEQEIASSGYVLHTLEASLWCFLKYNSYAEAVLAAVNLGADSDTTGCVTGGLAGLYYGHTGIPEEWIEVLAKKDEIVNLAKRFDQALKKLH